MKNVIVTGASRGIGAATALYFGERGWRVILNHRNSEEKARSVASEIRSRGGEAEVFRADVGNFSECEALVNFASGFGKLDLLVNNAAISGVGLFTDITP